MSPRPFLLLAAVGAFAAAVAVGIDSRNSEVPEALGQRQLTSAVASSERIRERESIPAKSAAELIPVPMPPPPPHYAARQVEVTFSDGKSVQVVVQKPMVPNPPYMPAEHFLDQYEVLAARAHAGDAAAARMIFRALQNCQRLQRSLQSKASDSVDENSQRRIRYCDRVDDRYLADASRWAKMASDGGDFYGRQDWALELQRLNRGAESVQQFEALWNDGYIGVLQALSIAYKKGLASNGEPDPVRAYAYFYLRYKLAEAAGWNTPGSRGKLGAMEQARQFLGGSLTAQEQQVAEDLALQLLSANTACCIGTL